MWLCVNTRGNIYFVHIRELGFHHSRNVADGFLLHVGTMIGRIPDVPQESLFFHHRDHLRFFGGRDVRRRRHLEEEGFAAKCEEQARIAILIWLGQPAVKKAHT